MVEVLSWGRTWWQVSLQVWRGSWGTWGGSRPAPNVTAEALGNGLARFLLARALGLWLKNQGARLGPRSPGASVNRAGAARRGFRDPRGLQQAAHGAGWPEAWEGSAHGGDE